MSKEPGALHYFVIARLNTSEIDPQIVSFVWRITGLVLLISAFVTIVTMLVMDRMVLTPIITLGDRLTVTGSDPNNPEKYIIETRRADEWGDVIRAFNRMLQWARSNLDAIKKKENELIIAKEETDKANMAKSEFLATMSHEIRTPMTGVVGMIDLLRETKLDADQKHMIRTVRDSAFTLLKIINNILDTSKIEAGKLTLETLPISLDDLVDGVAETLLPHANDKSVRLVTFVDPALPERIMADPVRISQILFNLGGNAVKFTENTPDNPGRVVIRADLVDNWRPGQGAVSLKVSDSGIGMSQDAIDTLFKPFAQAESSTTRRFGGTGLGLSICKSLTDIMGGDIGVESKQGEGSTFTVTLPLVAANEEAVDEDAFDLTGINVLTVFGNSVEGKFAVRYLNHHGAFARAVGGPDEARHIIRSGVPLDVVVIEGDAKKTIEDLRSESEGLCFVILTRDRTVRKGLVDPGIVVLECDPLGRTSFLKAVALAVGRIIPDADVDDAGPARAKKKAPGVEEARFRGQLILVAEDNLTNQDVIRRQLNLLGYACEFSSDGKEALRAWKTGNYAALLTDCHMPNMDGYQLTGAIRESEKGTDGRIPIIAITANALQGEGERCLESGMDDYLVKPLEMDKLEATLAKWIPLDTPPREDEPVTILAGKYKWADDAQGVIDPKALKIIFGDDGDTFKEILLVFIEPSQDIVREIMAGYQAHDAPAIGAAGHKLKSSSRAVGANALADLCAELEFVGKAEDWRGIEKTIPKLEGSIAQVMDYIKAL